MNNKIKDELALILQRFKNDTISLKYAKVLINNYFFVNPEIKVEIINKIVVETPNKFECEFKSTINKAICKEHKCIPSCLNKMKAEYIIFKEQKNKSK